MNNQEKFENAARYGDIETVRKLLPLVDPKADNSYALQWAAYNGHLEIVRLLIPVSDILPFL